VKLEGSCVVCANEAFRALPMRDNDVLARTAREFIQGMRATLGGDAGTTLMGAVKPSRRKGICMVERCARLVEAGCGNCRDTGCQRCAIAAELRDAETRLNAERDAELISLGVDDQDLDEMIDKFVGNLCTDHRPFGHALIKEWYAGPDVRGGTVKESP